MPRAPNLRLTTLILLPLLCATGCELARMELDPAFANVPAIPVEGNSGLGWKRELRFGRWQTTTLQNGSTKISRQGLGPTSFKMYGREYRFSMATDSGSIEAWCSQLGEIAEREGPLGWIFGVDLVGLSQTPPLHCAFDGLGGGKLQLLKKQNRGLPFTHDGDAGFEGRTWAVTEVFRLQGARSPSLALLSGFEIRNDGELLAAVEVINGGRVWIMPTLRRVEQDRIAVIAASLLLFQPAPVPSE